MRDTTSYFSPTSDPPVIDDRIYFQDVRLSQMSIKNLYEEFLAQEDYSSASNLLNDEDMDFFGASILNLFENRIVAIETYVCSQEFKDEKPVLTAYQSTEPEGEEVDVGFTWIDDE